MKIEYLIIIVVCVIIAIAIVKAGKKDFKLEANKAKERTTYKKYIRRILGSQ